MKRAQTKSGKSKTTTRRRTATVTRSCSRLQRKRREPRSEQSRARGRGARGKSPRGRGARGESPRDKGSHCRPRGPVLPSQLQTPSEWGSRLAGGTLAAEKRRARVRGAKGKSPRGRGARGKSPRDGGTSSSTFRPQLLPECSAAGCARPVRAWTPLRSRRRPRESAWPA